MQTGQGCTWVNSQRQFRPLPGQFSVTIHRPEVFGYHGIVVELAALEGFQEQQRTAALFVRSIGLGDYAACTALTEAGHVPATQIKSSKTARLQ